MIKSILELLVTFIKYFCSSKSQELREKNKIINKQNKINDAINKKEKGIDDINKIIKDLMILIIPLTLFVGCATKQKVIYVDTNEKVEFIIHNNIEGYFVPTETFRKILLKATEKKGQ